MGTNGYRFYELEDLLRLQQILVLRELGVALAEIGPSWAPIPIPCPPSAVMTHAW